jgi:transcription initiation factor TFIIIB Brf1 subunit/transcription initiation factor TFIIB
MALQGAAVKTGLKKVTKCPNCGNKRLSQYGIKTVCANCSFVIDPNSTKNKLKKRIRQNSFQTSHENPTVHLDLGENGSKKWQKLLRVSDSTERNLAMVLFEITKIGQIMSLPEDTLKLSSGVYKTVVQANLTKRTSTPVLAATIVYIACRQAGIARSLNEIAHLSKISPRKIRHTYNTLFKKLNTTSKPTMPNLYVRKLATNLFRQEKTVQVAEKTIQCLEKEKFCQGKNPVGLAASACYIASIITGETKTQREIAEAARVTEATLRTRYKQIAKNHLFKVSY